MLGVRIFGKNKDVDIDSKPVIPVLDFTFYDILVSIGDYASDLYWAHTGIIYIFPDSLKNEEYDSLNKSIREYVLHSTAGSPVEYMHRGFIEKFGRYIYSETLDLAGFEDIESLKTFDPNITDFNYSKAAIYFRCSDAASWDVYSQSLNIIKIIQECFGYTEVLKIQR